MANVKAATAAFMSAEPRPWRYLLSNFAEKGGCVQWLMSPVGTTSVCPRNMRLLPSLLPCQANRLSTSPNLLCSQVNPASVSNCDNNFWQPLSSGVIDSLWIKSWLSLMTGLMSIFLESNQYEILLQFQQWVFLTGLDWQG